MPTRSAFLPVKDRKKSNRIKILALSDLHSDELGGANSEVIA